MEIREEFIMQEFKKIDANNEVRLAPFEPWRIKIFTDIGPTADHLRKFKIFPIKSYTKTNKMGNPFTIKSTKDRPLFAYFQSETCVKIYSPLSPEKKYKFFFMGERDSSYVFGRALLPLKGNTVFITAGEKDCLVMNTIVSYPAICFNSENASSGIVSETIRRLKSNFKNIVVCYDNDETGLTMSEKMVEIYRIKRLVLPNMEGGKDLSDYVKLGLSIEDLRNKIEALVNPHNELEDFAIDFGNIHFDEEQTVSTNSTDSGMNKDVHVVKEVERTFVETNEECDNKDNAAWLDILDGIFLDAAKQGLYFKDHQRNSLIFFVADKCNQFGMSLEFVLEQMEKRYQISQYPDHLNTIQGVFKRYTNTHGIKNNQSTDKQENTGIEVTTPIIPRELILKFPKVLSEITENISDERAKDMVFLGGLAFTSVLMPNLKVIHKNEVYLSNLGVLISAPFSSGKRELLKVRAIGDLINMELIEISKQRKHEYDVQLAKYNEERKENPEILEPELPILLKLFLAANVSAAKFCEALVKTGGFGFMFETETQVLSDILKQDWAQFGPFIRKALSNETIEIMRKEIDWEIKMPYLSILLTGTPEATAELFGSGEDGLYSRFITYYFKGEPIFADNAFSSNLQKVHDENIQKIGKQLRDIFFYSLGLKEKGKFFRFTWKPHQEKVMLETFKAWFELNKSIGNVEASTLYFRMANMASKIAAMMSFLRLVSEADSNFADFEMNFGENSEIDIHCSDDDMANVLELIGITRMHTLLIFENLHKKSSFEIRKTDNFDMVKLYDILPNSFDRKDGVEIIMKNFKKRKRTADLFLSDLVKAEKLSRSGNGHYTKI